MSLLYWTSIAVDIITTVVVDLVLGSPPLSRNSSHCEQDDVGR